MEKLFSVFKIRSAKKKFLLLAMAIVMFFIVAGFIIFNFIFLISNFNKALGTVLEPATNQGFDIEGFEKLNLIKK